MRSLNHSNMRLAKPVISREGPFVGPKAIFEREMSESERVAVLLDVLVR